MPRLVTLLPEPDSPTIASDLPRSTENDSPSTALTMPSSVGKWMRRSRTSRNADGGRSEVVTGAGADVGPADSASSKLVLMADLAYVYWTRGSTNAYAMSTMIFATTTKKAANRVTPSVTGRSREAI